MSSQPNGKALSTLMAIVCVSLLGLVTVFAIAQYGLDGETMKWVVGLAIVAVAGLGGYEIREQMKA